MFVDLLSIVHILSFIVYRSLLALAYGGPRLPLVILKQCFFFFMSSVCMSIFVSILVFLSSAKRSHVTPLGRDEVKKTLNSTSWPSYFRFRRPSPVSSTRRPSLGWRLATSSFETFRVMAIHRGSETAHRHRQPSPPPQLSARPLAKVRRVIESVYEVLEAVTRWMPYRSVQMPDKILSVN